MREYQSLNELYVDRTEVGKYVIIKKVFDEKDLEAVKKTWSESLFSKYGKSFVIGKEHVCLIDTTTGMSMMSDHPFEMLTNQKFLDSANGDVLIFGLGIGLIILPLLRDLTIKSITVVECDKDVVDIITPIISARDRYKKLNVILGDAFLYEDSKKYDSIYLDIWNNMNDISRAEAEALKSIHKNKLKEEGWIDYWRSEE